MYVGYTEEDHSIRLQIAEIAAHLKSTADQGAVNSPDGEEPCFIISIMTDEGAKRLSIAVATVQKCTVPELSEFLYKNVFADKITIN